MLFLINMNAQEVMKTGDRVMPNEWIDADTHHKITKLTDRNGNNRGFHFHNNPFIDDKMLYIGHKDRYTSHENHVFMVELSASQSQSHHSSQLTSQPFSNPLSGEILSLINREVYYQSFNKVYSYNFDTKLEKLVFVFPDEFQGNITTVNADGSLLGGFFASQTEKNMQSMPNKFTKIFEARLPRTLFTINIKSGYLTKVYTAKAWLNHVQFSPSDPALLMFCHEGPWHKLDRIWTINIHTKQVNLVHNRSSSMEIAGHEWFAKNGNSIWYDLQIPRGENFYVAGHNLRTRNHTKYKLTRNEWSVHYASSSTDQLFAGDGGDSNSVAKATDGKWIYLFTPCGDHFVSEKLVNMKYNRYQLLEPNVQFTPNDDRIVFRANFEGKINVYAADIHKQNTSAISSHARAALTPQSVSPLTPD